MSEPSRLRKVVGGVEGGIAPPIERATRSREFAQILGITVSVRKSAERFVKSRSAQLWHALNLPAGTDVRRLRELVADLDRQIRLLQHQLEAQSAQPAQPRKPRQRGAGRGPTDSVGDGADTERGADPDQAGSAAQRPEGT